MQPVDTVGGVPLRSTPPHEDPLAAEITSLMQPFEAGEEILKDAKQRLMNLGDSFDGDHGENITHGQPNFQKKNLYSPLKVRSRGRPPMKRKQSKIEQIVKKTAAKSGKKGAKVVRRQEELLGFDSTNLIGDQSSQVTNSSIIASLSENSYSLKYLTVESSSTAVLNESHGKGDYTPLVNHEAGNIIR